MKEVLLLASEKLSHAGMQVRIEAAWNGSLRRILPAILSKLFYGVPDVRDDLHPASTCN